MKSKYGIGVVSKNTVDACIDYVNNHEHTITLIPSRRQVDFNGGYVNNWNTRMFSEYVKSKTNKIFLKRDHGGPEQGLNHDDGFESLSHDCLFFDAIHIDPWKHVSSIDVGCESTKDYIEYCYKQNPKIQYEVGTEESIFPYSWRSLDYLLNYLKKSLAKEPFENIKFAVIQSGTSLKENYNTGNYDKNKLIKMLEVCKKYGMLSKEHNGDYLPIDLIREKFKCGLDAINIAPEFGQIETRVYLNEIKNTYLFDAFFDICYNSKRWEKWVDKSFDPFNNEEKLINICGHYVLSQPDFISDIKKNVRDDIDFIIKKKMMERLEELYS